MKSSTALLAVVALVALLAPLAPPATAAETTAAGAAVKIAAVATPVPADAPKPAAPPARPKPSKEADVALAGIEWRWVKLWDGPGPKVVPKDPSRYTVKFSSDGTLAVQADCNRGKSTWKADGSGMKIGPIAGTKAACPAGSLSDTFLKALADVESWGRSGKRLQLILKNDQGILTFERVAKPQAEKG